ncbi:MAG: hypothetical protein A3C15_03255 [Candidatus Magasanikbacteria bacterium RIFCSPHIGHO2_02_FULL_50_9b]|uniref:YibE/F family protein n=1 Tax=Candidatus Magasanikbacteria bacterium RIFCSPHIGHO2_02_FULL_50_9b TaxID=1798682 RepID=A0A1F6M7C1_9BACT|nr:MAG: hypothetical protein A3C15_03255 [Candidatus Magasanikbacteria bacterium RIFCSPHIGHO2_02_FULL_50_9b]
MNKVIVGIVAIIASLAPLAVAAQTHADYQPDEYYRGTVTNIISETTNDAYRQKVEITLQNGNKITIDHTTQPEEKRIRVAPNDRVIVIKIPSETPGQEQFYISDFYRMPSIAWFAAAFFVLVILLGRWRGLTSIAGLAATIAVLMGVIIPLIIKGYQPLFVVFIGSLLIICASMFFAHGFKRSTSLAVGSTAITLALASVIAFVAVHAARLFGTGSEEAMFVQIIGGAQLDLRGILLCGIIIGSLGVLDDITIAQTAAIHELHDAKPGMKFRELFTRVMRIGREHIASLVNTLVLAYAGASFPLFLLFYSSDVQPLWVVLNSQQVSEEIVRTLVGSTALVLAVPISSAIAAYFYTKKSGA